MRYHIHLLALLYTVSLAAAPELVMVADGGNPGKKVPFGDVPNPYLRGEVAYPYRIGKSEITNAEYAEFLNACAAKSDLYDLFNDKMKIARTGKTGAWQYAPLPGEENNAVTYVSKVNAARYCNFLTSGTPERGAYAIAKRLRENGKAFDTIVGYRDLTFPETARVYYLPDMHEFFKAGWYDGNGNYVEVTPETRSNPSHYGIVNFAANLREHMDNKYYAGAPFVLGADDAVSTFAALNTVMFWQQPEYEGRAESGFRVAATAPLQIGDRLNHDNNFFFDRATPAKLRVRNDGPARQAALTLQLRDFADQIVWTKKITPTLAAGVNDLAVELPVRDGYYELAVTPEDPIFNRQTLKIPLAVMLDQVDNGAGGNFGFTCHITRRERRYSFEEFDFKLLRQLGVSVVRVDVGFEDTDGSQTVLKRIHDAGLKPLAIISASIIKNPAALAANREAHPEIVAKWTKYGIAADYAWYAENVYHLISANKEYVKDWEFGNEPTYWDCLPEDYAQALKAGQIAAKLADPSCNVMAGDLNAIHAPVFKVKGGEFCDSIATHIYGFYVPMFWGVAGKMRELNSWKNAANIAEKPVWITEIGGCTYSSMHMIPVRTLDEVRRYQAVHQPKIMAGGIAFGADKVIPYNFRDVPLDSLEEEFGMLDRYGLPKPGAASYRATAKLLGNAKFTGFLQDHSFKVGEIAGLIFKDAQKRDVIVCWRNDPYGFDQFKIPFFDLIKPSQTIAVKAEGREVELFDMSGGASTLPVENGIVMIPVSEYPVFVRGKLIAQTANVSTAHNIAKLELPAAKVKILPNYKSRACDLMSGVFNSLQAGTRDTVKIHVYNLQNKPLSGVLTLTPRSNWREWAWPVEPAQIKLDIPANGMGEGEFNVPAPRSAKEGQLFYLDAAFETAPGVAFTDTVAIRSAEKSLALADWITYAKGFQLAAAADKTQVKITWDKDHANFVSFYLRTPRAFAADAAKLDGDIVLPVRPEGVNVGAVSILFMDQQNETFQLKQDITIAPGEWTIVRFNTAALLGNSVIIHKGGNGKIDFPVRLLGFNFDLKSADDTGSITLKDYRTEKSKARWTPGEWTVYGEGYKLIPSKNGETVTVERTPGKRAYVSLFAVKPPVLAKDGQSWPQTVEICFTPDKVGLHAVSFLVQDAAGETFQLKLDQKTAPGEQQTAKFELKQFTDGAKLIAYGGNNDKKIDYPVKLLGFNFEFDKSDEASTLAVTPPEFDRPDTPDSAGGGGAVAME